MTTAESLALVISCFQHKRVDVRLINYIQGMSQDCDVWDYPEGPYSGCIGYGFTFPDGSHMLIAVSQKTFKTEYGRVFRLETCGFTNNPPK